MMLLPLLLLVVTLAGTGLAMRGLFAFKRANELVAAGDLAAAREAHRKIRRFLWPGLVVIGLSIPASIVAVGARVNVPRAPAAVVALVPLVTVSMFATIALVLDLRLQDRLRATPQAAAATSFDEAVTFDFTADDLWRSQMQSQWGTRIGRITGVISALLLLAMLIGLPLMFHSMHPRWPLIVDFIPSILSVTAVFLFIAVFGRKFLVMTIGGRPGVLCEHRIEVRADGLREVTHANDTLWPWADLKEVVELRGFVLLRVSTIGVFAIPVRAFASDDQRRRFVSAVRHRMSAGGAAVPTPA